ncbi:MAG: hypothetical protein KAS93_02370 [Gammaproteobacteria bacterium]|nr:hypothetical protein [Gammaproteobacteria bacterium]
MKKIIVSFSLFFFAFCFSFSCLAVSVGSITLQKNADGSFTPTKQSSGGSIIYQVVPASQSDAKSGYVIDNSFCLNKKSPFTDACKAISSGVASGVIKRIQGSSNLFYVKNSGFDLSAVKNASQAMVVVMVAESVTGQPAIVIEDDK